MAAVGEILQGMPVLLTIAVVVAQIAGGVACREGEGERKEKRGHSMESRWSGRNYTESTRSKPTWHRPLSTSAKQPSQTARRVVRGCFARFVQI